MPALRVRTASGWEDINIARQGSLPVEAWKEVGTLGYSNGWVDYDVTGGVWRARYRKRPDGVVELKGLLKNGTIPATAFTLPEGYRPTDGHYIFPTASESNTAVKQYGELRVLTDGSVQVIAGNATGWVSIACEFSTGQSLFPTGAPGPPAPVYEQPGDPGAVPTGAVWIDTDEPTPFAPLIPVVTTLPTSPMDGQEVIWRFENYSAYSGGYLAFWRMRYNAASPSPHKWECVGGQPVNAYEAATTSTTSTAYLAVGPAIAIPRVGDFLCWCGHQSGGITTLSQMQSGAGGLAGSDERMVYFSNASQGHGGPFAITLTTTADLVCAFRSVDGGNRDTLRRRLSLIPIRVS